ncbi:MAG: glycerol-3-phosphate 1-O-acyltransferase PlsY [bacterium]|nr:glycerol-3-phosphate 1-O-acyltransferase PlsY [bacterium]
MSAQLVGTVALPALGAYLLGSVPVGLLVARAQGVDIRAVGSGNIGATNVGRTLGRSWGVLVFLLDVLKGLGPTLLAALLLGGRWEAAGLSEATGYLCTLGVGVSAVLGHNYSVFLGFTGGKGVSATLGVALGVFPDLTFAALIAFGVWIVVVLVSRYVSLGSICGAVVFPVVLVVRSGQHDEFLADQWPLLACSVLLAGMIVYRHRSNLVRLFNGTEQKMGKRAGSHK